MNRAEFALAMCDYMGWPPAIAPGLVAVMVSEGSDALCNPLDDELAMPGATDYNSAGVKNYVSVGQALMAYEITLTADRYRAVRATATDGMVHDFVVAWTVSGWGTWNSSDVALASLAGVNNHLAWSLVEVAGTGPAPAPTTSKEGETMLTSVIAEDGTVHAFGIDPFGDLLHWTRNIGGTVSVENWSALATLPNGTVPKLAVPTAP